MRRAALLTLTVTALTAPSLLAQVSGETAALEARVWLDRGDEPVLRRGETVRIFYRATEDAYAAIFRIDTDGRIQLIYPQDPTVTDDRLNAGVDYRVIFPNSPVWRVSEDPGVGYLFMVASPERLDFSALPFDPQYGWDLGAVGDVVYEDPYVAIDDYVALLIPDWDVVPYGLDFVTYSVGDTYTYPRFLCYDCHDARPYANWNPYSATCTTYNVVIYDDPYFYPYYRYSGTSVVVVRPVETRPRYAVAVRASGDSYRPIVRTRTPPPRRSTAEFKESPEAAPPGLSSDALTPQRQPNSRPTLQRRPTSTPRLPVRTPPSSSGGRATPSTTRGAPDATIVRPAPRASPDASPPRQTPSRPSARVNPTPRSGTSTRSAPSTRPSTRPSTPSRSGAPSTRTPTQSRPTVRPAPSRPSTRSPSAAPRSGASSRPSARPSSPPPSRRPAPSRQPSTRSNPPSQPSSRPSPPPRSSGNERPTVNPRSNRLVRP